MSSSVALETEKKEEDVKGGELLFCGTTYWGTADRRHVSPQSNLISPTRLRPLVGVDIRFVASGSASSHCVALDVDGRCYTWGRNDKGQLGHGDKIIREKPTLVSGLSKYKVVKAGSGSGHTVVQTEDGLSFSFGWNKHGQLGTGSTKNEFELSPVRCLITDVKDVSCGAEFTVWLSSIEGASILTAGHPQYGQLGHGTDNEYNMKESSVKLAYEAQPVPKAIASLSEETIIKVACGSNHTVALDSKGYVYTWGNGGYGRLGHREQKDEFTPRRVDVFTKHNTLPPTAVISAGSVSSACTAGAGQMYMWGKIKVTGDNWMYPKPLMDLSGWNIRCMDSGNMHYFVGADTSCISWGNAQSGELGYGPNQQKSSAIPKKVDDLEDMHVIGVACGSAHSLVVVDRSNVGKRIDKLDVYDGKDPSEVIEEPSSKTGTAKNPKKASAAKTSEKSKKTTKSEEPPESEVEEENGNESEDASDEKANGKKKQKGGKSSGKGRGGGRPSATTKGGATPQKSNKRKTKSEEPPESEVEEENGDEKGGRKKQKGPSATTKGGATPTPTPTPAKRGRGRPKKC
ncbi:unnamed protein product [Lactuca saligna]|uniref:Uncharacterized protein n=1 Tax=Lactuca saligna TaxID=75948 RepID=A0AA36E325_LACSI|nr:unnamed protein product [Lactuca saligna]